MIYRLHQKLCKVDWDAGVPFLKFGTVTKVNTRNYYIDNSKKAAKFWFADAQQAIDYEYLDLFSDWNMWRKPPEGWTIKDTVRCVCRLRRLERKLIMRRKR